MSRTATHDRHGSNAGRGFRYQDAVAVLLAVRAWAGVDQLAIIIPEGNDDVERRSAVGSTLVQVKSRREHLGDLPLSNAKQYLKDLWDRHDKVATAPVGLELVIERAIIGHSARQDGRIEIGATLERQLPGGDRGRRLLAKTSIEEVAEPKEAAIALIVNRTGCLPIAADICFAQLLGEVGALADQNGRLRPADYRGLSVSDTERSVTQTLAAVDSAQIERALRDGACEPADFLTPINDPEFYLGVDVQPGHVAAGLVIPRLGPREALARGLEARGAALVAGPSGSGKSAIMWDTAYALRHTVRWYRLLRVDSRDLAALRQLFRTLRVGPGSPVGLVVDDIGRRGAEGWDVLTRELAAIPGALLLGSIREEDLFLLDGRARAAEVRAEPDPDFAKRLYDELKRIGRTDWSGWREPWTRSQGLILEYVHILSAGQRFAETLADQVATRERDPGRATELAVLRVVAFAGSAGATVEADRLASTLGVAEDDVSRGLKRLIDEHLVREATPGLLSGLHQLRSAELLRLTHDVPPPTIEATFARTVNVVAGADLEPLVADAILSRGVSLAAAVAALAARVESERDIDALAAILRGLGTVQIAAAVDRWMAMPSVAVLARTQVGAASFIGIGGTLMPEIGQLGLANAAAADLIAIRNDALNDPRQALLEAVPDEALCEMLAGASEPGTVDRFLGAQVGMTLNPKIEAVLDEVPSDILGGPLEAVAGLLGTLAEIDRNRAIALVDQVGEDVLVARVPQEVAWATPVTFEDAEDGRVARCDFHYIFDPDQADTHGPVVRICEVVLALSPRSDIAASAARAPNGEVAGSTIVTLAEKRISRANLPSAAVPAWNRRWRDAIAMRVASPTYSGYLAQTVAMLDRLAPALEQILDPVLRGRNFPERSLGHLGTVHDAARDLTPPAIAVADATGAGPTEFNNAVTKLQNVLLGASADALRRFIHLPDGVGAYIGWMGGLLEDLNKAEREEPWGLVGGVPPSLSGVRAALAAMRAIAGELAEDKVAPMARWPSVVKQARPGNALRMAGMTVANRAGAARTKLGVELRDDLSGAGIDAEVRVFEDEDAILPWPPSKVLVMVPIPNFAEAGIFLIATATARALLPETIRLTVMPTVEGLAVPSLAQSGFSTLLPLPDEANAFIAQLGIPAFSSELWPMFDRAAAMASALQSMDRLSLGTANRPEVEIRARARFEVEFTQSRSALADALAPVAPNLGPVAADLLDRVRSGAADYADAVHEAQHGGNPAILEEIAALRFGLEQAEFDHGS
ncbi:DUF4297 domain-containing protein [Sphingomonas endolithica]|uniref:DUF4297 domain-containing protein n=1 Tax=Sphingomonas endolithica TaxID=2972485 RepID=UPI0021AECC0C|nr:DUF4297 domain-containing protein [Sphingomonas sp. ZFBP2030]